MYKRIYKKACEEIKGDRDAILNKAFERAAEPEKKKSPLLRYSVIGTAAAAMIVAGAVVLNWDVFKMPPDDMVSEDTAAVVEESQDESVIEYEDEAAEEIETEAAAQRGVVTEEITPKSEKTEAKAALATEAPKTAESETEAAVLYEDAAETAEEESAAEFLLARGRSMTIETEDSDEDIEEETGEDARRGLTSSSSTAGSSGGSGAKTEIVTVEDDCESDDESDDEFDGGTMMLTAGWSDIDYNVEALTYEEYINYLGFDVTGIELPEGMSFDWIEESVYEIYTDEVGEIADDVAMFTASGEEKSITIMTTRMIALDEEFEAYENVAENVARNGDYAIYAVKNGAYVTIEFDNVASDDIDAIAGQLAE